MVTTNQNFIKIITMMVGELDISAVGENYENFSDYFKLENMYNTAIFICFVFMMCIIILSLFEGIAVGEIKDVLDKAHIEIISSNIFYVLKIQSILYFICGIFSKRQIPTFMNITEHKLPASRSFKKVLLKDKHMKRSVVKKIENDFVTLSNNFEELTKIITELTKQVRTVKKRLE